MERDEAVQSCVCRMCPSYVNCGEDIAFCLGEIGKSKCITMEKGCICPDCPVQVRMKFKHDFYCIYSSERDQSQKQ